ncbi:helix-turn-helix transcriptional regulator [Shumkonia mesophila]|uniref:helix-turn-helix transcriptional regulator n=1 Tax=Shumkonia mesophila TaxID=2838854 RepID=UPI002934BF21|nr:helix-turn-helix transcriptional regulator [Shumkonia mesophila]
MQLSLLSQVIQAENLEAAWSAVVELARGVGVAAIVKTKYRPIGQTNANGGARLELARLYLDPELTSRCADIPAVSTSSPPPAVLWLVAPAAGEVVAPPRDLNGLPVTVHDSADASDPFVERFARALQDHHGILFKTILTVPGTPTEADTVAEFLNFFATEPLSPDVVSLLGSVAGAYAGRAAVLASKEENGRAVSLRPQEIECIRWAVAGKSIQDIADITGLSYRSVRYQIDQARERYGYTSNLQTYVRASVDYGLDPLICPPPKSRA